MSWEIYSMETPTHKRVGVYNTKTKEKVQVAVIDRDLPISKDIVYTCEQEIKRLTALEGSSKQETPAALKPRRSRAQTSEVGEPITTTEIEEALEQGRKDAEGVLGNSSTRIGTETLYKS